MNRHSRLLGNDPEDVAGSRLRGQRVFCSDRGRRQGCGRTFPIFFADVLPKHTVTASWLWRLLARLLTGPRINAVVDQLRPPFALETVYHLLGRLRSRLDRWRSTLFGLCDPPAVPHSDPLLLSVEHLDAAFPDDSCPVAAFQLRTGRSLVG